MFLFGPRQVVDEVARREVAEIRDELVRTQSLLRQLETETVTMHDQVRRYMRRAVAAESAARRNQEPAAAHVNGHGPAPATPAGPTPAATPSRISLRGARARIAYRKHLESGAELLRHLSNGRNGELPATEEPESPEVTQPDAEE